MTNNNLHIEASIIGSLLLNARYYFDNSDKLNPDHFTSDGYSKIYSHISEAYGNDEKIDLSLFARKLSKDSTINFKELNSLVQNANPGKLKEHIEAITEDHTLNKIESLISEATVSVSAKESSEKIISDVTNGLTNLLHKTENKTGHVKEYARDTLDQIYKARESKGLSGIDTGLTKLNEITGGYQATDLIILGARPGMGKTTLCLNYLITALEQNIPCVLYSLEMSGGQILNTLVNIKTGISTEAMRSGNLSQEDLRKVENCYGEISDWPLFVLDNKRTISQILTHTRYLKRKFNIQLIAVDYLQLIEAEMTGTNRNGQIEYCSRQLKLLASSGDCNLTAIVLSQLNRSVETRTDKRPLLSDLRESGAIEQDADMVQMLYRDSYYSGDQTDNSAELQIVKHRHGRNGFIRLEFDNRKFIQSQGPVPGSMTHPSNFFPVESKEINESIDDF